MLLVSALVGFDEGNINTCIALNNHCWTCFIVQEEFGYNADTQKLLSKNGETLLGAINFFISSVNTLVEKTIEDTMINIKQYEVAR